MIYGCGWKNDILIEIVGKHYKGQISRKKRKCRRKYSIIVNTKYVMKCLALKTRKVKI